MSTQPLPVSRRERLRAQTLQEIEDTSFAIIDADGVHALTIAALGRSMAMSAPAVYRYFVSRDALIAHLTTLSYEQLSAAMHDAIEGSRRAPQLQVRLLVGAYRDWALTHRRRYGMLFAERPDDPAAHPSTRTPLDKAMGLLVDLLVTIQNTAPATNTTGDRTLDRQLRPWAITQNRPDTSPRAASAAILIWSRIHGIVSLELAGVFGNHTIDAQRLIDLEIAHTITSLTA